LNEYRKQNAMENKMNQDEGLVAYSSAVWNIQVGVFKPELVSARMLPPELKYWKLKVVLN
jgi:hypothetical protein